MVYLQKRSVNIFIPRSNPESVHARVSSAVPLWRGFRFWRYFRFAYTAINCTCCLMRVVLSCNHWWGCRFWNWNVICSLESLAAVLSHTRDRDDVIIEQVLQETFAWSCFFKIVYDWQTVTLKHKRPLLHNVSRTTARVFLHRWMFSNASTTTKVTQRFLLSWIHDFFTEPSVNF